MWRKFAPIVPKKNAGRRGIGVMNIPKRGRAIRSMVRRKSGRQSVLSPAARRRKSKKRVVPVDGAFTFFLRATIGFINRFCLEWAEFITQRDDALRINSPVQKDAFSGMNRRRFLKSSMAVAAVCGTSGVASLFSQAAFAEDAGIADGQTRRFDYTVLQAMAHDLGAPAMGRRPARSAADAGQSDSAGL